jgi:hypothetical protein
MRTRFLALSLVLLWAHRSLAEAPDARGIEFFEQKVRPVLVKHCYGCHSTEAKKEEGGLLLDSRPGLRKGGETGPAIVPGEPAKSLLLKAVRYGGPKMPPPARGKLPDTVIADLEQWIAMGAPDPRDRAATAVVSSWEEILKDRRRWWSLQPVKKPAVPPIKDAAWSAHSVDRFLLARLEAADLRPAPETDRRTLLRRLSFVLTGLPPTVEEVDAFVKDPAPDALEKQVDRLLASPHFGERWGQHWLDVVRYAETHGNEWNYDVPHAWRYRDYVIRAFNQDVPYDQFVREHIAGDLLPQPRWNQRDNHNESVIGTAFYRFGDGNVEDCIGVPQVAFDLVDNQIDTLGKAFQATTIACARCHDHKLDAVSMKDYYALVGILQSSRQLSHTIDGPDINVKSIRQLRTLKKEIRAELGAVWRREAAELDRYLLAAQARLAGTADAAALARDLDAERLQSWVEVLKAEKTSAEDPLAPWRTANKPRAGTFQAEWIQMADRFDAEERERSAFDREHFRTYADFRTGNLVGWQAGGQGLRDGPVPAGDLALYPDGATLVRSVLPAGCFTHTLSEKLSGTLRSPLITGNGGKRISLEVLGRHASEAMLVSHNCQLSDTHNRQPLALDQLGWVTFKLPDDPAALRCYLDLATMFDNPKFPDPIEKPVYKQAGENYRVPWDQAAADPRSFFGITRVVVHDDPKPPAPERSHLRALFAGPAPASPGEAAARYAAVVKAAVEAWTHNRMTDDDARWLDGLLQRGLLDSRAAATSHLAELARQYRAIETTLAVPRVIPGMGDCDTGFEQPLFVRGDCLRPGERVPRRYLEVLARPGERFITNGSGRRELAERIATPDNPLTARVMVNRVWHHVFGEGLVRTVDDFGHNGDTPSHPELLDYLAARFVEDGWSVKRLVRTLVLTRTFRLSNRPDTASRAADPHNRLLHYYPARRLEAEAIRDAILAASGRLALTLYGPSIEPFRDLEIPHQRLFAGPLDGRGRRSLYIKHTLMEGPKFLCAFNFPVGIVTQGRRDVTNVPSQALALLNDPFVLQQAEVWADRLVARTDRTPAERVEVMFRAAFGRAPDADERVRFDAALVRLAELHDVSPDKVMSSRAIWQDVAHMLFNTKEFIYIP